MIKTLKKYFFLLIICSLVGYLALIFSYILPTQPIKNNVLVTSKNYLKEGNYPNIIINNDATKIGNSTDQIMLLESIYDGEENPFIKAINVSRKEIGNNDRNYTLYNLDKILKGTETTQTIHYPRYWHGYLTILKPLLLVFNHDQIKYLNFIAQSILLVLIIMLMKKRNLNKYILPFLISICCIYPYVISLTMSFSIVYYLMLISVVILLKYWETISKNISIYFYLIGILTCYFDYFTWPLVTLGIPLIFITLLNKDNIEEGVIKIIKNSFSWLMGYSLMWLVKFGIGSLITGQNIFADGVQQAMIRSSAFEKNYLSMIESINYNFKNMLINRINVLLLLIIILVSLIRIANHKLKLQNIQNNLSLILISILPIIWILIVTNHTFVHYWMVYRILIITIFGIQCFLTSLYNE